jgi:prepilin-type N-terminal cleavage/methylation domain-containing protein
MKEHLLRSRSGFTLIEILVTIPLALLIMAGIYHTFKIQQDSYLIQDQVTVMQQNLRGAMYLITRDLLMAGFLSVLDTHPHTVNWDGKGGTANKRPIIIGRDNVHIQGDDVKDYTDTIVIVKASDEGRSLKAGESATGEEVFLSSMDVDLNTEGKKFGILVKQDYSKADFFEVKSIAGNKITVTSGLSETYAPADIIYRADLISYRIDEKNPTHLLRGNIGQYNGYQVVAENIENMQVRYQLSNGMWTDDPGGMEPLISAVQVFLMGRTEKSQRGYRDTETYTLANSPPAKPNDAHRRKTLSTIVKTRNIGL